MIDPETEFTSVDWVDLTDPDDLAFARAVAARITGRVPRHAAAGTLVTLANVHVDGILAFERYCQLASAAAGWVATGELETTPIDFTLPKPTPDPTGLTDNWADTIRSHDTGVGAVTEAARIAGVIAADETPSLIGETARRNITLRLLNLAAHSAR